MFLNYETTIMSLRDKQKISFSNKTDSVYRSEAKNRWNWLNSGIGSLVSFNEDFIFKN